MRCFFQLPLFGFFMRTVPLFMSAIPLRVARLTPKISCTLIRRTVPSIYPPVGRSVGSEECCTGAVIFEPFWSVGEPELARYPTPRTGEESHAPFLTLTSFARLATRAADADSA